MASTGQQEARLAVGAATMAALVLVALQALGISDTSRAPERAAVRPSEPVVPSGRPPTRALTGVAAPAPTPVRRVRPKRSPAAAVRGPVSTAVLHPDTEPAPIGPPPPPAAPPPVAPVSPPPEAPPPPPGESPPPAVGVPVPLPPVAPVPPVPPLPPVPPVVPLPPLGQLVPPLPAPVPPVAPLVPEVPPPPVPLP